MTIETIVCCSADELERMTDAELLEHFKPYLNVTRPENNPRAIQEQRKLQIINPQLAKGLALAKSLGIDVPTYRLPIKRK
jgi:hypothetical protein